MASRHGIRLGVVYFLARLQELAIGVAFPLITAHFFLRDLRKDISAYTVERLHQTVLRISDFGKQKCDLPGGQQIGIGVLYLEGAHVFLCAHWLRAAIILIPLLDLPSAMNIRVVWGKGIGALLRARA